MNNYKIIFFLIFSNWVCFIENTAMGQTSNVLPSVPRLENLIQIPKSPEAFAFAKYGNTSISHFTGVPNISVPLGELKGRDISIPIELTYDASGIRVDQVASEIGLGWNLKIGGMIVRNVKGLPDDYSVSTPIYYPYYSTSNFPQSRSVVSQYTYFINNNVGINQGVPILYGGSNWAEEWPVLFVKFTDAVERGYIDTQPDTYTISVNGISGTIVIDYATSTGYCIDNPEIKVVPNLIEMSNGVKQIDSWQITDGNGNYYTFGFDSAKETTQYYENNSAEVNRTFTSAWKLNSITTGRLKEIVTFNYIQESWSNDQPIVSYYSIDGIAAGNCSNISTTPNLNPFYKISSKVLSSVQFSSNFGPRLEISRTARTDLPGQTSINQLKFNDEYGAAVNYVKLIKSYFNTPSDPSHLGKRLKLDLVEIHGNSLNSPNPMKYEFSYDETPLPSRNSLARDYYGYFNGANSNTTLLDYNAVLGNGANRQVNELYQKAGILTSVKYPTKGFTNFYYQSNKEFRYSTNTTWQNAFNAIWTSGTQEAYCDDIVGSTLNVQYHSFTAPVTGTDKVTFDRNLGCQSQVQLVAIYQGNKSLCDLVWENGSDILYKQYSIATNQEVYINLQAGKPYKVAMANNALQDGSMQLTVARQESVTEPIYTSSAGLRIQRIEDYSSPGVIASKKYYYYSDGSALTGANIISLVNSGNYQSSGILQNPVQMERNQIRQSFYKGPEGVSAGEFIDCNYIERSGSSMMNGNGMNFTYSSVSELSTDDAGEFHLKVYHFQNESEVNEAPYVMSNSLLGKLSKEVIYGYSSPNGSFYKVEEVSNVYENFILTQPYTIKGLYFYSHDLYYQNIILDTMTHNGVLKGVWTYSTMLIAEGNPQGCNVVSGTYPYCIKNGPLPIRSNYEYGGYRRQFPQLVQSTSKKFIGTDSLVSVLDYSYESTYNYQVYQVTQVNSKGETILNSFSYPTPSNNSGLYDQNRLKELTKTQNFVNGVIRKENTVIFSTYNTNQILPQRVEEKINNGNTFSLITINSYDNLGNVREVTQRDGIPKTLIFGHGGQKLVLEVIGATYSEVLGALGGTLSFGDSNRNFSAVQVKNLRSALSQALVNQYVYGSVFGLTRLSDPRGRNTGYSYDSFGRLTEVRDHDNNLLESYSFNVKN